MSKLKSIFSIVVLMTGAIAVEAPAFAQDAGWWERQARINEHLQRQEDERRAQEMLEKRTQPRTGVPSNSFTNGRSSLQQSFKPWIDRLPTDTVAGRSLVSQNPLREMIETVKASQSDGSWLPLLVVKKPAAWNIDHVYVARLCVEKISTNCKSFATFVFNEDFPLGFCVSVFGANRTEWVTQKNRLFYLYIGSYQDCYSDPLAAIAYMAQVPLLPAAKAF